MKNRYALGVLFISVLCAFILSSCPNPTGPKISAPEATEIQLNSKNVTLYSGGTNTVQLKATFLPTGAAEEAITWTSSNEAVATVDANGLVTRVADVDAPLTENLPQATITASNNAGDLVAECEVKVNCANPITDVYYMKDGNPLPVAKNSSLTLEANQILGLGANFQYGVGEVSPFWIDIEDSENTRVFKGKQFFNFSAINEGTYTIHIKPKDGAPKFSFTVNATPDVTAPIDVLAIHENSQSIILQFEEPYDKNWGNSFLNHYQGPEVKTVNCLQDNQIQLIFKNELVAGKPYDFQLKNVKDLAGNELASFSDKICYMPLLEAFDKEKITMNREAIEGSSGAVTYTKDVTYDSTSPITFKSVGLMILRPGTFNEMMSLGGCNIEEDGSFSILPQYGFLEPGTYHLYIVRSVQGEDFYYYTFNLIKEFSIE